VPDADHVAAQFERARRLNPVLGALSHLASNPSSHPAYEPGAPGPRTLAVKDNIGVAGMPSGCGSTVYSPGAPERSATAVQRLVAAGMVVIGKAQMPELAFGGWGTNEACGTPWNPWVAEDHFVPGGSSSGSAVAVAAGLADAALGTDTGGSVRIPAALCGTVGLKPSFGRVSRNGVHLLSPTLDVVGPIARNVIEAARLLEIMSGPDPADPATQAELSPIRADAVVGGRLGGLKLGGMAAEVLADTAPDIRRSYDSAVSGLASLGAEIAETKPPRPWDGLVESLGAILGHEAAQLHGHLLAEQDRMDQHVAKRLRAGLAISDADYTKAMRSRAKDQRRFNRWLASFDAFLTPTTAIAAVPIEAVDEDRLPLSIFTRAVNYLDWTAISLPCGLTERGLPLGLQIVAGRGEEMTILRIAAAFEAMRGPFPLPDMSRFEIPAPQAT